MSGGRQGQTDRWAGLYFMQGGVEEEAAHALHFVHGSNRKGEPPCTCLLIALRAGGGGACAGTGRCAAGVRPHPGGAGDGGHQRHGRQCEAVDAGSAERAECGQEEQESRWQLIHV
jgi:hypothetical protein